MNSQTAYPSMTVVSEVDTGFLAQFENYLLPENECSHPKRRDIALLVPTSISFRDLTEESVGQFYG